MMDVFRESVRPTVGLMRPSVEDYSTGGCQNRWQKQHLPLFKHPGLASLEKTDVAEADAVTQPRLL
jgi:hypothetical protein